MTRQLHIEIAHQQDRYDRWVQTHSWDGERFVALGEEE